MSFSIQEDVLNSIIQTNPNAIILADDKGEIHLSNKKAEEFFGYTEQEFQGVEQDYKSRNR